MLFYPEAKLSCLETQRFAFLDVSFDEHLLTLTLNRPEKKNAMNNTLMRELAYALSIAHNDANVWMILLKANGDVFCAGADLRTFAGEPDEPNDSTVREYGGEVLLGELFRQLNRPCIAQVEGPVLAGGFLLLGGSHFVVAADDIQFSLPEVRRGIFPMQVMAALMSQASPADVLRFCLLGEPISAEEAKRMGIISHAVHRTRIDEEVAKIISALKLASPTATRAGLQAFADLQRIQPAEQHNYLRSELGRLLRTADAKEGIAAFREKRQPKWTGK